MFVSPVIFGFSSTELNPAEIEFFRKVRPFGYILFSRNIAGSEQVKHLNAQLRALDASYQPQILVDQEGGRVARLRPPFFDDYPSMESLVPQGHKAIEENFHRLGSELREHGFTVNCAPVLDLKFEYADKIIGDRSFGDDPIEVAKCAKFALKGLNSAGIEGVIKHIPGHGRALVDSHLKLPIVDTSLEELDATDFKAFKEIAADAKYAMTAHIIYSSLDPQLPATLSPKVIAYIRNEINFKGLIMTDDLSMEALSGSFAQRTKLALSAGCDLILHCNGKMAEMLEIAEALERSSAKAPAA